MAESIRELRKICQPPLDHPVLFLGYFRRISIYFTKLFLILGLTANQASLIQIVLLFASLVILVLYNNIYFLILSAVLLNLSLLFDHVDGEIARYRGCTHYGRFLDVASHDLLYLVHIILGFGAYYQFGDVLYIALGASASLFMLLFRLHQMRFEFINIDTKVKKKNGRAAKLFYGITLANFFLAIMYIMAFFNIIQYFLIFYGIYIPVFWAVWAIRKRSWLNTTDKGERDEKDFWDEMREHV